MGVSVPPSNEPEIRLTATTLNLTVQDAGLATRAGILSGPGADQHSGFFPEFSP